MKRCALRIFVFLLLGAIVNVAVAWGCAWKPNVSIDGPQWAIVQFETKRWKRSMTLTSSLPVRDAQREYRGITVDYLIAVDPATRKPVSPPALYMQVIASFGLPCRSMDYELDSIIDQPNGGTETTSLRWALCDSVPPTYTQVLIWNDPNLPSRPYCLPLRPIWSGFAINTVLYAAILWLLFAAPFALRRRRRIKRGLCPKCAYPVGTSDVCTECGGVVRSRGRARG